MTILGKTEYLDALKRAMTGLPPEAQAKTLAYYEQRFVDGVAEGRSEADVAAELDDPKKIAMTLRASTHLQAFQTKKSPGNFFRMAFAGIGLTIFNLFMIVPAMVYFGLLAALYATGVAFYLAGVVITASGLSGANEIRFDGPMRHVIVRDDNSSTETHQNTKVAINVQGINVTSEPATGSEKGATVVTVDGIPESDSDSEETKRSRVIKHAESVAGQGILVSTDMDDGSRAVQTFVGIGMVLGGIVLLLLSLVVTKYTFIGIKRYVEMNLSLLRGN